MSGDLVLQSNGPYLRIVLPDFEPSWNAVLRAVDLELEDGITRAEIVAPSYPDEDSLRGVRELVAHFEDLGVDAIVEWQGMPQLVGGR